MRISLFVFLLLLNSCKGFESVGIPISSDYEDLGSDASSITPEMGGSNYAFIEIGKYATNPTEENWATDVKVPVVHYHLYQQKVRSDLQMLIRNGQKKISIPLWFNQLDLGCETNIHTVCPQTGGKMPLIARQNLQNILKDILSQPFNEVQLRLGAQGGADVNSWTKFEEAITVGNTNFILDVVAASEEIFNSSVTNPRGTKIFYDLGMEQMGHRYVKDHAWHREYLKRVWLAYIAKYAPEKSIGFSFNHAHREGTYESLKVFDDSGKRPAKLGIDIYVDRGDYFRNLQWVLDIKGWGRSFPIFIQETYRNDAQVAQEVLDARSNLGLNILTIMQWPLDQGFAGHTNSTDYSFDNYK